MKGDAFQERLDRVLKRVPSTTGTADDIMAMQKSLTMQLLLPCCWRQQELIISLPMKRSLSLRLDCPFFGGNLTPHRYKIDPQKVQVILV